MYAVSILIVITELFKIIVVKVFFWNSSWFYLYKNEVVSIWLYVCLVVS